MREGGVGKGIDLYYYVCERESRGRSIFRCTTGVSKGR